MAAYQEYRDEEVSFILIDDELSEKGKLIKIKNHYKARLLGSGTSPQTIQFVEKEIREEILYEQKRIQTAFNNLSFSRNEANENLAMGNISLMREALGYALAEIANEVAKSGNVSIPIKDQHEFNEAKKLGREVDDVKAIHAEQLEKARKFYDESKSWGMLLWGAFLAILIGTYVYMYSPVIMQMIHGIGQSGTDEARRTEKLVSGIATVIGILGWLIGLGLLFHAGMRALVYPIALVMFIAEWISIRASLIKTQAYNGEAKKQAFRALLWAVSPSFLLLGLAGYYIFQPFSGRSQITAVTTPTPSSFQPNALTNRGEPIRDANNANANIVETLAINTPIFILHPEQKRRWYEVQTQSGKTGWIDGYGFRLASTSEIASYTGGNNTNSNTMSNSASNSSPFNPDGNSNSEVATATPYANPFAEYSPTPVPTPPPIADPDLTYRDTRLTFHRNFKARISRIVYWSNKYKNDDDQVATNEFIKPLETPLKNVISSIDANLLNDLNTLIARFEESVNSKFYLFSSEMDFQVLKKYKKTEVQYAPADAPERDVYADRGIEVLKGKRTQIVGMLEKIASASPRTAKQSLITECINQLYREQQETQQKQKEIDISRQEAGY